MKTDGQYQGIGHANGFWKKGAGETALKIPRGNESKPTASVSIASTPEGSLARALGYSMLMLVFFGLLAFHTHSPEVLHGFFDVAYPRPLAVMESIIDATLISILGRAVAAYILAGLGVVFIIRVYRLGIRGGRLI